MTDQELAKACQEGKREAQREIFKRFSRVMMTVCLRYAGSREEAEDMLQEGFIRVFERIHQYESRGPLGGWIRTLMVNNALNHLRKTKKMKYSTDLEEVKNLDSEDVDVLSGMSVNELLRLIAQMPDGYRTVFNLFAVEGYTHQEIAQQLEISENTSKTQFMKARGWLRRELERMHKTVE